MNTVSRRFAISMLTSLRLLTRAPCTRIRSWLSAACCAGDCVSVLVAPLIVSPSVRRAAFPVSVGVSRLDLTNFAQCVWFSFVGAVAATVALFPIGGVGWGRAMPVRLTLAKVGLGA